MTWYQQEKVDTLLPLLLSDLNLDLVKTREKAAPPAVILLLSMQAMYCW